MKEKKRILFVNQEVTPYLPESPMSKLGRHLPQGIQERGREIRTFMPRYGSINERRNQLHEVIRLSGMNLIIDDSDHPLIIKVASIQLARMQFYFIDNEDFFHRKYILHDKDGKFFKDNHERAVFFCRGVLETVKKLGWAPDIIHCNGWMSALVPLYVKKAFNDNPLFSDAKVVVSLFEDKFDEKLNENLAQKVKVANLADEDLKDFTKTGYVDLMKNAITFADGVIQSEENVDKTLIETAQKAGVPFMPFYEGEDYVEKYNDFYKQILGEDNI